MVDFLTRLCSFSRFRVSSTNFLWVLYDTVGIRDTIVDGSMMLTDEVSGRERVWPEARHCRWQDDGG